DITEHRQNTQSPYIVYRVGERATLSCGTYQPPCDYINWLFNNFEEDKTHRLINEIGKTISERLHFTDECSLVIKEVRTEDVGQYSCREKEMLPDHVHWLLYAITSEYLHHTNSV
uniref:Ig-like domain-containing protein n=1 Tax=Mola mola TaxID=94237 RepID=A0A3Q3X663_MOLML